ncbi:hypothetical protein [Hyphomicrobium sp. CS1GBMeth3]|uniref:hypothetical protein n=1 Tax=Hyphomicrobium sp. CS1GBMeth3 TaxID=1892845 RepID=UPI000A9DA9C2|nr:hypothetical protein [Hyphomicrobium sp. CS1GBMeth3]
MPLIETELDCAVGSISLKPATRCNALSNLVEAIITTLKRFARVVLPKFSGH